MFGLVNITSKHGRKRNNALLENKIRKKKQDATPSVSKQQERRREKKRTGRNQTNKAEGKPPNAVCENHNVVMFIQKYIYELSSSETVQHEE